MLGTGWPLPVAWGAGTRLDAVDQTDEQESISDIIDQEGEDLSVKRRAKTWTTGQASVAWGDIASIAGIWQPVSGETIRNETGLNVRSTAQVFTETEVNLLAGDRIYREDGTFLYVNYVGPYSSHWQIMLTGTDPL